MLFSERAKKKHPFERAVRQARTQGGIWGYEDPPPNMPKRSTFSAYYMQTSWTFWGIFN